jgi:bifunctional enzyme CysN/CysC
MNELNLQNPNHELITLLTAGSVDDGKSTLIGRLLCDTGQVYEDQKLAVEKADHIDGELDYSLFTDGLSAEREQKITIDVAYRYFATEKRRFVLVDVPGHEQYTKNMVTGASKAQVALLLVDARTGIVEQSKRHLTLCSLLGIEHIVVVINKMDLVDYEERVFLSVKESCESFAKKLSILDLQFIPASSLKGDMVVERGGNMSWYGGRTVMDYLETVSVVSEKNLVDFRFPVQYVIRPDQDTRGYAGKIEGGIVRQGDEVVVLPTMQSTRIKSIIFDNKAHEYAYNPLSVVLTLEDELDVSRGSTLVKKNNIPDIGTEIDAMIFWMDTSPLTEGGLYLLKHNTTATRCEIRKIQYRFNIEDLHKEEVGEIKMNEIGKVYVQTNEPLMFDSYKKNSDTGAFIIIDELTGNTIGAGIIIKKAAKFDLESKVEKKSAHVLWFTGLSGSGKSTLAEAVALRLREAGMTPVVLDGDVVRKTISSDLGFSETDRIENIRRVTQIAELLVANGITVLVSFISPYRQMRERVREIFGESFHEVYIDCPLHVCEQRDVKGLYKKARAGEITNFTGISDPYEEPGDPEIKISTHEENVNTSVDKIIDYLDKKDAW